MNADLIAKRYAAAFIKCIGDENKQSQQYLEPLHAVASLFDHADARRILASPVVPAEVKKGLFDRIFKAQNADQLFKNFIYVILDKNRIEILPFVAREFQLLLDAQKGVTRAEVVSSLPLDAKEEADIHAGLKDFFQSDVEIQKSIDPNILGGFVVKVGNRILDMSLKAKLDGVFQKIAT